MNNSLHIHIYWILSLWFTYSTVKCSPNVTGMDSEFNSSDELTTVGIMSSATRTSAELSSAYPDADLMTSSSAPNSQFNTTSRLEETTHLSDADLMTSSSQSSKFVIVSHPGETTNLSDVDVMTSSAQSSQFTTTSHLEETTKLSDTVKHEEFIFDAGSNSTIECEMSSESSNTRWDLSCMGQDNGLTQIIPFYNGEKISIEFADAFDVQSAETGDRWASVVTLLNIGPHHAGQYKCLEASDDLVKMWQRISIIAQKLECSVNSTDVRIGELDSMLISCRVTYVGDLKSAFHCLPEAAYPPRQYTETGTVSRIVGNSYNVTSTLQTSIYDHVIIANREQNGHQLTCEVEMTSESIPGVEPAVSMGTWVSKPLTVTYGPIIRNMSLDEQHSNVMTCYVDGNPPPNITWLANKNDSNVGGHRLNMCGLAVVRGWVTGLRPDADILTLTLECVASGNNIRTSIEKFITNSRGSFKAACPSIAATTEAPGLLHSLSLNATVKVNSSVEFSCSSSSPTKIRWNFYAPDLSSQGPVHIFNGESLIADFQSRFTVNIDPQHYASTLMISNVQLNDSGTYQCRETSTAKNTLFFELVTLATDPTCSVNQTSTTDYIEVQCTIKYYGNVHPNVTCSPGTTSFVRSSQPSLPITQFSRTRFHPHINGDIGDQDMEFVCNTRFFPTESSFVQTLYTHVQRNHVFSKMGDSSTSQPTSSKPSSTVSGHAKRSMTQTTAATNAPTPMSYPSDVHFGSGNMNTITIAASLCLVAICITVIIVSIVRARYNSTSTSIQRSTRRDANASRRTHVRPSRPTVHLEPDVTQVYTLTEQYTQAVDGTSIVCSMNSIDHYSEISQKSREDEEQDRSYESLDQKSIQEVINRQPGVYAGIMATDDVE